MRRRLTVVIADDQRTFVLRGWRGGELAREAGLRPIFSGVSGGWVLDADRLPDLLATAQARRIVVDVIEPNIVVSPGSSDQDVVHRDDDQLDLFGPDGAA